MSNLQRIDKGQPTSPLPPVNTTPCVASGSISASATPTSFDAGGLADHPIWKEAADVAGRHGTSADEILKLGIRLLDVLPPHAIHVLHDILERLERGEIDRKVAGRAIAQALIDVRFQSHRTT